MRKRAIGVIGPGRQAGPTELAHAFQLGKLIAEEGWVLLTGGRNEGVMEAASQGARAAGGLTVGILPGDSPEGVSQAVEVAIVTDLGNARNNLIALSSEVAIACGMGLGTASEVALALKNGKPVVLLTGDRESQNFFTRLSPDRVFVAESPQEAIVLVKAILPALAESG